MEEKLCIRCRHHIVKDKGHFCTVHTERDTNLVTGVETWRNPVPCQAMRYGVLRGHSSCGKEGKYYDQRSLGDVNSLTGHYTLPDRV